MSHLKTSFEGKKKSISEFHVSVGNESFFSLSLSLSLSRKYENVVDGRAAATTKN